MRVRLIKRRSKTAKSKTLHLSIKDLKRILSLMVFALIVASVIAIISSSGNSTVDEKYVFSDGIFINGINVGGMTREQTDDYFAQNIEDMLNNTGINFTVLDEERVFSAKEMGCSVNIEEVYKTASSYNGNADSVEDIHYAKVTDNGLELTLFIKVGKEKMYDFLLQNKNEVNIAPTEPTVSFDPDNSDMFSYIEGENGFDVDMTDLVNRLYDKYENGSEEAIAAIGSETTPKYTVEDVKENTVKITSYTTYFKESVSSNRVFNIIKMAGIINGQVIKPGEVWSINEVAGPRTEELGWKLAPGIENGLYSDQPGGGICQISTTLFNAAIRAELELVEHKRHSWPSYYAPEGLDATISTGSPDLKLQNPYETPIYILAKVDKETKSVTVDIYGAPLSHGYTVDFVSKTVKTEYPPAPDIRESETDTNGEPLEPGESVKVRDSKMGIYVEVYKRYIDKDGKVVMVQLMYDCTYSAKSAVYYENRNEPTEGTD
ncbi:MAG: VanW family protein [Eubacteriales bacterium]